MDKRTVDSVETFLDHIRTRGPECVFERELWRQIVIEPHNEAHQVVYFQVSAIVLFEPDSETGFLLECVVLCGNDYMNADELLGTKQAESWQAMVDRMAEAMGIKAWEGKIEAA